jgi:glycerophosphoryl diester phosphodiesterase
MMHTTLFKAPISRKLAAGFTALLLSSGLSACDASVSNTDIKPASAPSSAQTLPPIRKLLSCLPENAAIMAAHRGTDKNWSDQAENSITALNKLIDHGTMMAEIDVAGLKDGTLILFHDGVWDDVSTGKGPIAVSQKSDLENILLKSRAGEFTADRPPLLADYLTAAKGKTYLEIDFKSSANRKATIKAIRDAGMADQVLLIAYTPESAAELNALAPEMLRSNPPEATQAGHAVWLGYDVASGNTAKTLKSNDNFIIGRLGDPKRQPPRAVIIKASDILVTDYAQRDEGIVGLTTETRAEFQACLER